MNKYREKTLLLTALYNPRINYNIQKRFLFVFWKTIKIFKTRKERHKYFKQLKTK